MKWKEILRKDKYALLQSESDTQYCVASGYDPTQPEDQQWASGTYFTYWNKSGTVLEFLVRGVNEPAGGVDCQHFFRQIFLGYFSDIVQAFDTLRKNVCGDDYTSLHNPIVLSSVLPAYGMFHSIQILFL